jgi:nitrilase
MKGLCVKLCLTLQRIFMRQHRVAVVQAGSQLFNTPRTLERMAALRGGKTRGRATGRVPEAYIGGYPKGLDFGAGSAHARPRVARTHYYWRAAIEVDGPECRTIGGFAAEMKAHGRWRHRAGWHHTLLLHAVLRPRWRAGRQTPQADAHGQRASRLGAGDGSTLPVIETPMGKVGSAICWENYMPLLRQAMYDKGVDLWCAPTVDEREIWQSSMRHIAYEGRMFVLSACQYMTRADAPDDYAAFANASLTDELIKGQRHSQPDGRDLGRPFARTRRSSGRNDRLG